MTEVIQKQWKEEAELARAQLSKFERMPKQKVPLKVLRVNQLDAITLDQELNDILKLQFDKIFAPFKVRNCLAF